jgi:hypothetical protein
MPSGAEYADRLLKQLRETLSEHLTGVEAELEAVEGDLSAGIARIQQRIGPVRNLHLPNAESLFSEAIDAVTRERNEIDRERGDLEHGREEITQEREELAAARDALEREKGDLLRERLELAREREALGDEREEARRAAAPPPSSGGYLELLAKFVREIRTKETQEEILNAVLEAALPHAPRVAMMVARPGGFVAWSSRGYPEDEARRLAGSTVAFNDSPLLRGALQATSHLTAENLSEERALVAVIGTPATPLIAFPVRALHRPVAVLLASGDDARGCNLEPLAVILDATELSIENLALRVLQDVGVARLPAEAPAPAIPEARASGAEPQAAPAPPASPPEDRTAPKAERAAAAPLREAPPAEQSEEERIHSEAKRFARLLVSEIKLYNQARVVEGRQNRDLYVRLKRDIDKSREMYERRFSRTVARKVDYFHDEVIRILGENDPSTLGSDYPGPRAES